MANNSNPKKTANKKAPAKKAAAKKAPAKKAAPKKSTAAKKTEIKVGDSTVSFVNAEKFVNHVLDDVASKANFVNVTIDKNVQKQKRSLRRFFKKLFK